MNIRSKGFSMSIILILTLSWRHALNITLKIQELGFAPMVVKFPPKIALRKLYTAKANFFVRLKNEFTSVKIVKDHFRNLLLLTKITSYRPLIKETE
jgi:hypothetical protein